MGKIINEQPNDSKIGRIVGIIFLIWFFASMGAMFYFSKVNTYYTMMIFGQYFLVFGIIPFLGKVKNRIIGVPFMLVGLACIIIPYLMMKPEINGIVINWDAVIVLLFIIAFILSGLAFILIPIIRTRQLKIRCSIEVVATIVKHRTTYSNSGNRLLCPIYEFQFNGKKYKVMNNQYTNIDVKPIGTLVNLKINPDNPEEFLDKGVSLTVCVFIGLCFLIISIPILIIVVKNVNFVK